MPMTHLASPWSRSTAPQMIPPDTKKHQKWRDTVADMMAEPRTSVKFANIFPQDSGWG
jgi:hypothetical protein